MSQVLLNRIEVNPNTMVGKPVIKGTRIPVELVLKMLSQAVSIGEILEEHPQLTREDIQACLAYAAHALEVEEILPLERAGT